MGLYWDSGKENGNYNSGVYRFTLKPGPAASIGSPRLLSTSPDSNWGTFLRGAHNKDHILGFILRVEGF